MASVTSLDRSDLGVRTAAQAARARSDARAETWEARADRARFTIEERQEDVRLAARASTRADAGRPTIRRAPDETARRPSEAPTPGVAPQPPARPEAAPEPEAPAPAGEEPTGRPAAEAPRAGPVPRAAASKVANPGKRPASPADARGGVEGVEEDTSEPGRAEPAASAPAEAAEAADTASKADAMEGREPALREEGPPEDVAAVPIGPPMPPVPPPPTQPQAADTAGAEAASAPPSGETGRATGAAKPGEARPAAPLGAAEAASQAAAAQPSGPEGAAHPDTGAFAGLLAAQPAAAARPTAPAAHAAVRHTEAAATGPATPLRAVPIEVGLRALEGIDRFDIRLDPAELGRIDVRLDIDRDSRAVKARLTVDRPETLQLLQRDSGLLEQALAQAGLTPSPDGLDLTLRDPGAGGQPGAGRDGADQRTGHPTRSTESHTDEAPAARLTVRAASGLDIRI